MSIEMQEILDFVADVREMSPNIHPRTLAKAIEAHFKLGVDILYLAKLYNCDWLKIMNKSRLFSDPMIDGEEQMELHQLVDEWLASEGYTREFEIRW
jgi:coproporphyrinogen III oxidase-like Fe-S oxidoreductase